MKKRKMHDVFLSTAVQARRYICVMRHGHDEEMGIRPPPPRTMLPRIFKRYFAATEARSLAPLPVNSKFCASARKYPDLYKLVLASGKVQCKVKQF